ncbi:hypothetical protein CEXT_717061 [Caerostris extrusa]|uniref:Uncharacterized protein n=1 Tax=Caerostris extrusa TaxID=172846 RepID=A0AAV4WPL6_CAEEX|nr:hypothetical protein CEXT_717061 [Caerostris extrusa]
MSNRNDEEVVTFRVDHSPRIVRSKFSYTASRPIARVSTINNKSDQHPPFHQSVICRIPSTQSVLYQFIAIPKRDARTPYGSFAGSIDTFLLIDSENFPLLLTCANI